MAANTSAVGDRGTHSSSSGTEFRARRPDKKSFSVKLIAAVALALVLIVATVACFEASLRIPLPVRSYAISWTNYTIDSNWGFVQSIAIDSADNVHVCYCGSEGLMYATNAGGSWSISTIDNESVVCTSLALDSDGKAHISYSDERHLKYATNVDGSWSNCTIGMGPYGMGTFNSIALDSNNKVHISYSDSHRFELAYITNVNGSWEHNTIEHNWLESGAYFTGFGNSIALDYNNKVHISYCSSEFKLKYATNSNGPWELCTLSDYIRREISCASTSIAVDSNNKVHISYNGPWGSLMCVTNANGSWVYSLVDTAPSDPRYNNYGFNGISLALDSNDKAHISYHPANTWTPELPSIIKYATNASGTWETSKVDDTVNGLGDRFYTSLALDSSDNVYVAYYTAEDLKYATNAETVIPEFGAASVVVVIIATICVFVALRRTSLPSTKA